MSVYDRINKAQKEREEEEARSAVSTAAAVSTGAQGSTSRIEKARRERTLEEAQAVTRTVTTAQEPDRAVAPAAKSQVPSAGDLARTHKTVSEELSRRNTTYEENESTLRRILDTASSTGDLSQIATDVSKIEQVYGVSPSKSGSMSQYLSDIQKLYSAPEIGALESAQAKAAGQYYTAKNAEAQARLEADAGAKETYEGLKDVAVSEANIRRLRDQVERGEDRAAWDADAQLVEKYFGVSPEKSGSTVQYLTDLQRLLDTDAASQLGGEMRSELEKSGYDAEGLMSYETRQKLAQKATQQQKDVAEATGKNWLSGLLMNAASVAATPLQGLEYIGQLLGSIGHNDPSELESYIPLDINAMPVTNTVRTIRGTTAENIDNRVIRWLYENGMSIADSAAEVAAFGPASVFVMSGSAAANQMKDVLERGGTNRQAILSGAAAGAAEALFEKISIDKLLSQKSVTGWRSWLRETAKQAGVEASEEMFTEVANILSDAAIMGENSEFSQRVTNYTTQGLSADEAKKKAFLDSVGQVAEAGLGGLLSGGVMGGAVNAYSGVRTSNAQTRPFVDEMMENILGPVETQEAPAQSRGEEQIAEVMNAIMGPVEETQNEAPLTIEERRAELSRRYDALNTRAEELIRERENGADTSEAEQELFREYNSIENDRKALDAQEIQQRRVAENQTSKGINTPENHIDQRNYDDVSKTSVKAFQFDHPELHDYFAEAARALLADTEFAINTTYRDYKKGTTFKSTHQLDRAIRLGLTKPEILKVCEDIIANNGQENYAKAKKVEIILNDMLTRGYKGVDGYVEPNEAYIAAKEKINGADSAEERYVKNNQLLIDLGDVTEEEVREEFRAGKAADEQKNSAPEGAEIGLVPVSEQMRQSLSTGKNNIVARTAADIVSFVKNALQKKGGPERLYMGTISGSTARLIKESTGVDVTGYNAILPGSSVQHIFNHHGNESTETPRGQRAVTAEDISLIPQVLASPDSVTLSQDPDANGRKVLIFTKQVGDTIVTAQAVTDGRHAITTSSLWIQKKKSPLVTTPNARTSDPSLGFDVRNAPPSGPYEINVSQPGPSVNPETQNDGLGAADRGFAASDYNSWVENAERFHPEGENAARNPSLPTRNLDGANTSKVGQTVMEAENTPDERVIDIQNEYLNGKLTINSRANSSLVQEAVTKLAQNPDKALNDWTQDVRDGKVSNKLVAMGAVLLDSDKVKNNGQLFMDVLTDYVKLCSTTGQALQAQRIYKALSPEGRLYMIKKVAEGLTNDTGAQMEISGEEADGVLRAKTDEEMNAALDRIYKHLAEQIPSTFKDKWTALRYMNMLGNFKTQIRNLMGNTLMTGMRAVKNEVAAGIEAAVARLNPNMERTQSARVGKAWMEAAKADFENVKEAAQGNGRYDDTSRTAVEQEIQSRRRIFKSRTLEGYRKITNWATSAGDEVFIKHHYARALAGYLKANGVRVEQFLEGNVDQQLLSRATDFAIKEAQEATFHDNNAFSDWVSKLGRRESTPKAIKVIGEGVAPFRKTPANVLVRAYEYSPVKFVGFGFNQAYKAIRKKPLASTSEVINSMAKGLTGSGILALGMALRAAGFLRGTGDDDDEAIDSLMNRQDYSIVIPGVGSYTIDWLTPATMPLFMGANLWDIIDSGEMSLADMDDVLAKFTEPILETSMLSGVNDALNNIKYSENHLGQAAASFALSYITQGLTNTLAGQIERVTEPNRMTTYTSSENPLSDWLERTLGQASAKIPVLDFQQTEYRDEFGKTESNGNLVERIFENIISPGYWTPTHEGEQLYDELQDLHDETGEDPWPDASPPKSFTAGGEKYTLDQEAKEKYQQTQGDIYTDLGGQVLSKGKRLFTPEEMVDILANIKSYAGAQAKKEFYEDHDIEANTTVNFIGKAVAGVQKAGIPFVTYLDFWCKKDNLNYEVDENGKKKVKEAVVKLIDSMRLTDAQKDWLYNEEGYKGEVTWH